ncbi:CHAP domain-containing protein [Intestinimonas massiliensis (ex Afouda et al. 2020)]|uniref:CHAP domain-containing protein n=1 Tax=Intestinimonas massiliensis (ex Afouda et al. 2020) TaxID=1673721 RepID=UPI001031A359|nr:CHAP domain-containing protein [Intestinimonas massiliensis (ex Afouda et al. 2020)]
MTAAEEARQWLGYLEHQDGRLLGVYTANPGKGGYTIFAQMTGLPQGLPWCATFVHAVYGAILGRKQAQKLLGKPHPGTRKLARLLKRRGQWRGRDYVPAPGNIIFLSPAQDGRIGHCGIVAAVKSGMVISIDGNTVDPDGHFPPEEGGAVARRSRALDDSRIVGYGVIAAQPSLGTI